MIIGQAGLRIVALPAILDINKELAPGETFVSPYGEGARSPTFEGIYWTRNFRFDPESGEVLPDVIRSRCNGLTPGVVTRFNPHTREWDVNISQWVANQTDGLGHIRVDTILGEMPPECDYDQESYAKYVKPLMTASAVEKLKESGIVLERKSFIQLTTRVPPEFRQAIARAKGDTPDDVKKKVAAGEKAKAAMAAYRAVLAKVYDVQPGQTTIRA